MNTDFIKGVVVPIITPIDENERIDEGLHPVGCFLRMDFDVDSYFFPFIKFILQNITYQMTFCSHKDVYKRQFITYQCCFEAINARGYMLYTKYA